MSIVLFCTLIITPVQILAQDNDFISSIKNTETSVAPVIIDGRVLFNLRGVTGFPAKTRAEQIANRIKKLATDPEFNVENFHTEESGFSTQIMANKKIIFHLLDADARLEYIDRKMLAKAHIMTIQNAIQEYRHSRTFSIILKNTILVIFVGFILIAALFFGVKLYRWLDNKISQVYEDKFKGFELQSYKLIKAEHIWSAIHTLNKIAGLFFAFVLTYGYCYFALSQYPWTFGLARQISHLILDPVSNIISAITSNMPNMIFLVILYYITKLMLKLIKLFFKKIADKDIQLDNFEKDWAWPTYKLVRVFVVIFALVISYPYIPGSGSDAFKGISIFIGVLFSLGSSSAIANIIAGYSMIYRRAFKIGDRIKVGDFVGEVTETRLLATYLRTTKNERIVVPNSKILNQEVINYNSLAKGQGIVLHTTISIGYETPWRQVEAMLLIAAERTSELLKTSKPFVLQQSLGDFAITYEINVYCQQPEKIPAIYSELHCNILDVFNEHGVAILTPAYETDPHEPKLVTKDQWYAAPAVSPNTKK